MNHAQPGKQIRQAQRDSNAAWQKPANCPTGLVHAAQEKALALVEPREIVADHTTVSA